MACEALLPVITPDERASWHKAVKSIDAMLPYLVGLLNRYGLAGTSNQLLATYYDSGLLDPPKGGAAPLNKKQHVYDYGDSSLAFMTRHTDVNVSWWQDTRQGCRRQLEDCLKGHGFGGDAATYYFTRTGEPTEGILTAIKESERYT